MAVNRYYSSTAVDTTLAVGISASATSITVSSTTGFPTSYPYTLAIDYDTSKEELVNVVGASGTTLTVGTTVGVADITGRGVDQGAGYRVAHDAAATVKHVISGRDVREPQEHIAASTNVHGIADTSALITASSTTVMTNKSLTAPVLTGTVDVTAGTLALGTTGSVTANSATVTAAQLGYVSGATSNLQSQISAKAPVASPTFTGTVTIPTGASITSPTITGPTVTNGSFTTPSITSPSMSLSGGGNINLGFNTSSPITANAVSVSSSEVARLVGVTSGIQGQIDGKLTIPTSWTSWTPTWGGTSASSTGATVSAVYNQIGKTVQFRISVTYGTASFGSAGVTFSTPSGLTPVANTVGQCISWVNGSGNRYTCEAAINSAGTIIPFATPTTAGAASRTLTTLIPFTWGSTDVLLISGTYEVA